jgi:hypothetical protein
LISIKSELESSMDAIGMLEPHLMNNRRNLYACVNDRSLVN